MRSGVASFIGLLGLAACTKPVYTTDAAPFACVADPVCPEGYTCVSGLCVHPGAELPPVLVRSSAPVRLMSSVDIDRNGSASFWTTVEDQGSPHAGAYATFIAADGTVRGPHRILDVDARGQEIIVAAAPIPHTNGKILVSALLRPVVRAGATPLPGRLEVFVWTPFEPNGVEGEARSMYVEAELNSDPIGIHAIEANVVGDEVWMPVVWNLGPDPADPGHGNAFQVAILEVGAPEIEAWRPYRRNVLRASSIIFSDLAAYILPARTNGAWMSIGRGTVQTGWVPPVGNVTLVNVNDAAFGIARMLATNTVMSTMGTPVEESAWLWFDPLEGGTGRIYRVGWRGPIAREPRIGPRLPVFRADTPSPGSFRIDDDLYVVGAAVGDMPAPASLDGGVDAGSDANAGDVSSGPDEGIVFDASTSEIGPLAVYRVRWNAASGDPWTQVAIVEPRVARAQVPSAVATPMPGGTRAVGLTWEEFYPSDMAGNGPRYVVYAKRQLIP